MVTGVAGHSRSFREVSGVCQHKKLAFFHFLHGAYLFSRTAAMGVRIKQFCKPAPEFLSSKIPLDLHGITCIILIAIKIRQEKIMLKCFF